MKWSKEPKSFLFVFSVAIGIIVISAYSFWSPVVATYKGKQDMLVYSKPNITSVILGVIPAESQVKVYEVKEHWLTIEYKKQQGYLVNREAIK